MKGWQGNSEVDWKKEGTDYKRDMGGSFDKVPNTGDAEEAAEIGSQGLPAGSQVPMGPEWVQGGGKSGYDPIAEKGTEPLWDKSRENSWPGGTPSGYKDGGQMGPEKVRFD